MIARMVLLSLLLGMSFLRRVEMVKDGDRMLLIQSR